MNRKQLRDLLQTSWTRLRNQIQSLREVEAEWRERVLFSLRSPHYPSIEKNAIDRLEIARGLCADERHLEWGRRQLTVLGNIEGKNSSTYRKAEQGLQMIAASVEDRKRQLKELPPCGSAPGLDVEGLSPRLQHIEISLVQLEAQVENSLKLLNNIEQSLGRPLSSIYRVEHGRDTVTVGRPPLDPIAELDRKVLALDREIEEIMDVRLEQPSGTGKAAHSYQMKRLDWCLEHRNALVAEIQDREAALSPRAQMERRLKRYYDERSEYQREEPTTPEGERERELVIEAITIEIKRLKETLRDPGLDGVDTLIGRSSLGPVELPEEPEQMSASTGARPRGPAPQVH